ncbi:hypothetical protein KRZ98_06205 [Sphingobium sp. AS12]|uniref:phage tail tape measure C-terminal domain-containing protein n=1 Tax=Sphingobium sp. AS12 TaxID=2849495 RepID=UPI001C31E1C9|nr:phage tail tape measure C-terminal domain-containing protein [Sphingobium sp. AS12]MBV2147882.1 hypothetical protein [Sphingobium sp. AS12]
MAEQLGDAVLVLRTDDRGLNAGVDQAEAKSKQLGRTFDATSGSATKLGRAMTEAGSGASRLAVAQGTLTSASGAQRAGLQQLGMQVNDMATMYALGARPMQIFASQIGQVTQAVQLMSGGSSRLATFLGGPWGIALSTAAIVLTPLIGNLLSADKAMKDVKFSSNAVADAQTILGDVFDFTTGKIKTQSSALLGLAQAQLLVARIQAQGRQAEARGQIEAMQQPDKRLTGGMGGGFWFKDVQPGAAKTIASDVLAGRLDPQEATRRLDNLQRAGALTPEAAAQAAAAIANYNLETQNLKSYQTMEDSLRNGVLDPTLRTPGRDKKAKGPKGKTAEEIAAEQAAEIERLGLEELRAKLALATTAEDRRDIAIELLEAERDQRVREIETNKDLSDAQKAARMAFIDRLYGKSAQTGPDGSMTVGGTRPLLAGKAWTEFEAEQAKLANDVLGRQAETLLSLAEIEPNTRARARLEKQALDIQQQIQRNLLEQQIASGNVADAEQARALLAQQQAAAQARQSERSQSPGQRYAADLRREAANINDAIDNIKVDGLERLNDELTKTVMGTQSLGATFKNVANQIIADLIRIAIRQAIVAPLAQMLFPGGGGSGGGGGLFGSLLGGVLGGGGGGDIVMGGAGLKLPGLITGFGGGTFDLDGTQVTDRFAGMFAGGGLIPTGTFGIVGERGPEPVISTAQGAMVRPNASLSQMSGGDRPGKMEISVSGARGNREIMDMVRQGVAQALSAYDGVVANRVKNHLSRRG